MRWSYYSAPAAPVNPVYLREIKKPLEYPEAFRLSEKSLDFSDSLKNAVTFAPLRSAKVLAALAERLAKQGIQGIRSHSRRAAAPSSSPALTQADFILHRFFDKLKASGISRGFHKNRVMPGRAGSLPPR